jgi:ABC-type Fe3+-hydroxamate transport system substrate-binding protein
VACHAPIAFLATNPRSLTNIESDIRALGRNANRAAASERVIQETRQEFKDVARCPSLLHPRSIPRVCWKGWPSPRISSPPGIAELVEIAGDNRIVPGGARVIDRDVTNAQPDVIVLPWTAAGDRAAPKHICRNETWRNVPAVKTDRVFVIREELLDTPCPPHVEDAWEWSRSFHPEGRSRSNQRC